MDELIPLSNAHLDKVPNQIGRPAYDRKALKPGIVHIGLGNFHRAHQSWYLHRLMQVGVAHDWAIIGAGVRPNDAVMRDKLLAQDCLTTLIELNPTSTSAEIVGSMIDFLPVEKENGALIDCMAVPAIRIVSLTVTEGGYYIDPVTNGFDARHPDILHDAAHPGSPRTAFGAMVAALKRRRDQGLKPFTVQSCDNLQGNGAIARQTVVSLARLSDPDLADWIDANGAFPNSMVDCIVPATGPVEVALALSFGLDDKVPVTHEAFRQWVCEDDFCDGRPAWDAVGVTFTDNVHAYEAMKIRMLNAGHQVLANVGEILGLATIADCMADPQVGAFFTKVLDSEVLPHVDAVPGMTAGAYLDLITQRFSNPAIEDTTRRVAFDGSARHTGFLLPTVRDALDTGASVSGLALAEALWARMCAGTREDGSLIEPNDPYWDDLCKAAHDAKHEPRAWLAQSQIYGELVDEDRLAEPFEQWLSMLWAQGSRRTLEQFLGH